jgi:uncharacterized phosphosugar-binding protein
MNTAQTYFEQVTTFMQRLFDEEQDNIALAGQYIADTIAADRLLHIFGTGGHSAMSAEEIFFRAGGLVAVNAILDEGVLLAHGALRSNGIERTPGYAPAVLEYYGVQHEDVLVVVNAYGINACTIDAAQEGKRRNCKVIAVTSVSLQQQLPQQHPSRHPSGQNLADVADVVIDCKVPMGDALVSIAGVSQKVGASSTYLNALALNLMMIQAIENLAQRGIDPPIWQSANSPGGDEANQGHIANFKQRIKKL